MKQSVRWVVGALFAAFFLALSAGAHAQGYPARPITLLVPWGAGDGSDATARIIGTLMERELGRPVNVMNRTGGSGLVGHEAIASSAPDGYTIGLVTVEITIMHWAGLAGIDYSDFTPIALVSADPAAISVRADAPYGSASDLVAAIKANPGRLKASGAGRGGVWHLALAGLLREQGIDPAAVAWVTSQGAAPGLSDLLAGRVDLVICPVPQARPLIEAGKVRPLAIMGTSAWRVIAGPRNLPADAQARLVEALKKVHDSSEFRDFMAQRGFRAAWAGPKEAMQLMAKADADNGAALKALGITK